MKGIWNNPKLKEFNPIPKEIFSIGEGQTPISSIIFDNQRIWIKDENANPTGSFKDRCIAFQLSYYYSKGR